MNSTELETRFYELDLRVGQVVVVTLNDGRVVEARACVYGCDIKPRDIASIARPECR